MVVSAPATAREPLLDGHGRRIGDLRVSVTDRCNFRCQYCMPAEGLPWLERSQILSFEEIERLVGLLATMGVKDVRLTGGEPLVRSEFPELVAKLARRPASTTCPSPPTATSWKEMPTRSPPPASGASTCRSTRSSATASMR